MQVKVSEDRLSGHNRDEVMGGEIQLHDEALRNDRATENEISRSCRKHGTGVECIVLVGGNY
jgi:hypothetical protein